MTIALMFGTGFCVLLILISHHTQTAGGSQDILPETSPAAMTPNRPRQLIPFTLHDQAGGTITRADLRGKFLVVSFMFTSCSLTCPVVTSQMAKIQQLTTNQPDVELISLTVNPAADTVPVLAKYGQRFDANTNRWLFLTGNQTAVHHLIGTSFLTQTTNSLFTYMPGNFANTDRIAVVDPKGKVRAYFDGLNSDVAGAVVAEIARLRNEFGKTNHSTRNDKKPNRLGWAKPRVNSTGQSFRGNFVAADVRKLKLSQRSLGGAS